MEVEADGVAHAAGDDLRPPAGEVDPGDRRVQRPRRLADVARRADRHVEPAVRAEGDELPAVVLVGREGIAHDLGLRRSREVAGHVAESQDAAHLGDVQGAVAEGEPARQVEPARQHVDLIRPVIAVPVDHRVHLALGARARRTPRPEDPGPSGAHWGHRAHRRRSESPAAARCRSSLPPRSAGCRRGSRDTSSRRPPGRRRR